MRSIVVQDHGNPVTKLNELEYIHGQIYANIWHSDRIARISPATGGVLGWIDLSGLLPQSERSSPEAVLNGIAYDSAHDRLFVTGKLWPKLFEIKVVPNRQSSVPPATTSTKSERRARPRHAVRVAPSLSRVYFPARQSMDATSFIVPSSLQNAAVLTIMLAFAGYLVTFMGTRMMARRADRLRLVNQRLNEFYGPLYVATVAGNIAYKVAAQEAGQNRRAIPSATRT